MSYFLTFLKAFFSSLFPDPASLQRFPTNLDALDDDFDLTRTTDVDASPDTIRDIDHAATEGDDHAITRIMHEPNALDDHAIEEDDNEHEHEYHGFCITDFDPDFHAQPASFFTDMIMTCDICNEEMSTEWCLYEHIFTEHGLIHDDIKHTCDQCDRSFEIHEDLKNIGVRTQYFI